jgi:nicotinamide-nucleotide amidase
MNEYDVTLLPLAEEAGEALRRHDLMCATAESCTGGWIAQMLTSVAGSSHWFDRGFVTYTNTSKEEMLGVMASTLEDHGAVSEATVREMAEGALRHSHAQVAVSVSGVAGPGGGSLEKPVGTVWIAWAAIGRAARARQYQFHGSRQAVRAQAVEQALKGVLEIVNELR